MGKTPEFERPQFLRLYTDSYLVVPQWKTDSVFGLAGAMLAAVAASVTYECLHEYLVHLRRASLQNTFSSECCGEPAISCWEKLGQTIIYVMRAAFSYFLFVCVMTHNIWLLVAVTVGASVGYGVGKPLIANGINDVISSHGYRSAGARVNNKSHRRSERSKSWRYQAISGQYVGLRTRPSADDVFSDDDTTHTGGVQVNNHGCEVVWLRRSSEALNESSKDETDVSDLQMPHSESETSASNFNTWDSDLQQSTRSISRFKPTSKMINASFRSNRSDTDYLHRKTSNPSVFTPDSPETLPKASKSSRSASTRTGPTSSGKVSRASSSASSRRFKPTSKQIQRELSFNSEASFR